MEKGGKVRLGSFLFLDIFPGFLDKVKIAYVVVRN